MELWIWVIAGLAALLILVLAFAYLAAKSFSLGKRLQPFISDVALFRKSIDQYPEAVKFLTEQATAKTPPSKGPRATKD
jgi:hypothetical protein